MYIYLIKNTPNQINLNKNNYFPNYLKILLYFQFIFIFQRSFV
jgi:hypothetical protein